MENLSNALSTLIRTQAMQWLKAEIIKRTVLAAVGSLRHHQLLLLLTLAISAHECTFARRMA